MEEDLHECLTWTEEIRSPNYSSNTVRKDARLSNMRRRRVESEELDRKGRAERVKRVLRREGGEKRKERGRGKIEEISP
eukprot:764055-Hanusia_phi.AAC.5